MSHCEIYIEKLYRSNIRCRIDHLGQMCFVFLRTIQEFVKGAIKILKIFEIFYVSKKQWRFLYCNIKDGKDTLYATFERNNRKIECCDKQNHFDNPIKGIKAEIVVVFIVQDVQSKAQAN